MPCIRVEHEFFCGSEFVDLRPYGAKIWMCWHRYLGPVFYRSAATIKPIEVPGRKTWAAFEKWKSQK